MNYGRYQILKEVGRGSMGVVYQARDPQIDRLVAVKVLRQDRVASEPFVKRFLKEAKVIGRLSHPNIVTIYDVGEEQGNVYIAMEFLEGKSLSDVLIERHLAADEIIETGMQIAGTLDYAHRKGVIHRDIKPSNIIIAPDGRIRITDFGVAHIDDSSATLQTQTGDILGTPAYMSPEQISGHPVDGRSDIFSLGVILYEMSSGGRPFGGEGKTLASIFNDIIRITPPEPCVISSLVPKNLSGLIMKALEKEPGKRFQTAAEFAEALKKCLRESGPSGVETQMIEKKKPNYIVPLIVMITVIIFAGGFYYISQHRSVPHEQSPVKQVTVPPKEIMPIPEHKPESPGTQKPKQETRDKDESTLPLSVPRPRQSPGPESQKPLARESKPAPKLVPLTLRSAPQGAQVYIDDNFRGITPLTVMLSTGEHRVRLALEGYVGAERQVTMEETMEYPLTFNLKAVSASD